MKSFEVYQQFNRLRANTPPTRSLSKLQSLITFERSIKHKISTQLRKVQKKTFKMSYQLINLSENSTRYEAPKKFTTPKDCLTPSTNTLHCIDRFSLNICSLPLKFEIKMRSSVCVQVVRVCAMLRWALRVYASCGLV